MVGYLEESAGHRGKMWRAEASRRGIILSSADLSSARRRQVGGEGREWWWEVVAGRCDGERYSTGEGGLLGAVGGLRILGLIQDSVDWRVDSGGGGRGSLQ